MKRRVAATTVAVLVLLSATVLWGPEERLAPSPSIAPTVTVPVAMPREDGPASAREPTVALRPPQSASDPAVPKRVCGLPDIPAGPDADEQQMQAIERHTSPMLAAWRERLIADADPRRRAVGLMLVGPSDGGTEPRDPLVALALATREPAIVGMAVSACGNDVGKPGAGACANLDPALWAEVDGGHAEPWLHLAGVAWEKRDTVAVDSALRRAVSLPHGRRVERAWFGALRDTAPPEADTLQRYAMGVTMLGRLAATWNAEFAGAREHCAEQALLLPGRRLLCEQLADLKVYRGGTLLDRMNGGAIGKRLGWSADRLTAIDEERRVLQRASMEGPPGEWMSCAQIARQVRFIERWGELGEVEAAREMRAEQRR